MAGQCGLRDGFRELAVWRLPPPAAWDAQMSMSIENLTSRSQGQ